ncbi:acyl-CoA dehydrogenase family protein, partial [Rhodococcus sp. NPDC058514]
AESDAVFLENVNISDGQLVRVGRPGEAATDKIQQAGFVWFEMLMTSGYLGIVSGLLSRVLDGNRGDPGSRIQLVAAIESSAASLESVAVQLDADGPSESLLSRVLLCRYAAQRTIVSVVDECVELLGGMAFISPGSDVHLYAEASRCLAFHPPGLQRAAPALIDSLSGGALRIV